VLGGSKTHSKRISLESFPAQTFTGYSETYTILMRNRYDYRYKLLLITHLGNISMNTFIDTAEVVSEAA
jgi:hypothetical protein